MHFNWIQLIPEIGNYYPTVTAVLTTLLLFMIGLAARFSLNNQGDKAYIPAGRFSIKGLFELLIEFIVNLSDMVIGSSGRKFVPLFATIFVFILANNLVGLIPGMTPATEKINTTLAIGIFAFVIYNAYGFKEHGVKYIKHFLGPVIFLAPLMLPIEIISHIVRPFSLGLRLSGNMTGDHTVLAIALDMAPIGVPMFAYCLGIFVCFIQAFVFTLLSMVYVAMAISHDH